MTSEIPKDKIHNDVLAVMRSETDAMEAVIDLEREGFEREGIRIYHPGEIEETVDPTGKHSGLLERLLRTYQGIHTDEYRLMEEYEEAGRQGLEVIAVHVYKPDQADVARDILRAHNGENIRHFGTWAVTDLEDQGRATS